MPLGSGMAVALMEALGMLKYPPGLRAEREMNRLRAENDMLARANDRLNKRAEIAYRALERIIAEGPPEQYERVARDALLEASAIADR